MITVFLLKHWAEGWPDDVYPHATRAGAEEHGRAFAKLKGYKEASGYFDEEARRWTDDGAEPRWHNGDDYDDPTEGVLITEEEVLP